MIIHPADLPVPKLQAYLQSAVAPRPIAFVSSVDAQGNVNLSPFSFFNMFSMNPPILVFSPSRRVRDNTTKHTLQNVLEVPEVTINIVSYSIVEQVSLASCEYAKGVNEFTKAGFTAKPSQKVRPPYVAESPVSFECKVNQVLPLGEAGGAGNLVICEVLLMHIQDLVLDENEMIDPYKLDAVTRMGGAWYCRANGSNLFKLPQPATKLGIGFDQLPTEIRHSKLLTGRELAILAGVEKIPLAPEAKFTADESAHGAAQAYLAQGKVDEAWRALAI